MYISKISINNFRRLQNSSLDLREKLSLLIGKNNAGKTSFLVLLEKFFEQNHKFNYNDFSLSLRDKINNLDGSTEIEDLSIRMILEIQYDENDNLENLSNFILDLDPNIKTVKILFECLIDKEALLKKVSNSEGENRRVLIVKHFDSHLKRKVYSLDDEKNIKKENRYKLIEKKLDDVKKLINLQIIPAKRNVVSSEDANNRKPLSILTTDFFNNESENNISNEDIAEINDYAINMDKKLNKSYEEVFKGFMSESKKLLEITNLNVRSNIQSKTLLSNSSHVIYGDDNNNLPEHLNGLGYMNMLYLLLKIEIKKSEFDKEKKDINLLFIEEPEAHTHPQMQYIFAAKIVQILEKIKNLQTLITSHSPHIVSKSNFEDIRYLKVVGNNVEIKNFHTELKEKYGEEEKDHFKFLEQYLNIQSTELFFASKVIFIEGITECMLLPYFIKQVDEKNKGTLGYRPLASQNISILEVGANAKTFSKFLDFLDIKTLVITDLDTTKKTEATTTTYPSCRVEDHPTHTSNETLKYFLSSPKDVKSPEFPEWLKKLLNHSLKTKYSNIGIFYQSKENDYHARSFEDSFINLNLEKIRSKKDDLWGLKNESKLVDETIDMYELTRNILDKKSDFAASILFLALSENETRWITPSYIVEGLEWIARN